MCHFITPSFVFTHNNKVTLSSAILRWPYARIDYLKCLKRATASRSGVLRREHYKLRNMSVLPGKGGFAAKLFEGSDRSSLATYYLPVESLPTMKQNSYFLLTNTTVWTICESPIWHQAHPRPLGQNIEYNWKDIFKLLGLLFSKDPILWWINQRWAYW